MITSSMVQMPVFVSPVSDCCHSICAAASCLSGEELVSAMKIIENTSDHMVIARSSVMDRLFFSVTIAVGFAILFFGDDLDAPDWVRLCFFGLFVSGGIFFWLISARVTVTLDGREGEARVHWARMIGEKVLSARLDDIVELRVQMGEDAGRLRFHLENGSTIPLTPYSYTGGGHPEVMESINAWLANWTRGKT